MKTALMTTLLAGLFCVGCNQPANTPATGEQTPTPMAPTAAAPGDTMAPPPATATPAEPMDLTSLAPAEPTPAPKTEPLPPPPAPAPTPAVTTPAAGGTYTIKKGDTFIKIAREVYGNASVYKAITAANPGVNPRKLKVGQVINLPDVSPK